MPISNDDWFTIHNRFYRDLKQPIPPIIVTYPISTRFVEVEALADSIPDTWRIAGWLQQILHPPLSKPFPQITGNYPIWVNTATVLELPLLKPQYYVKYTVARRYKWQTVRIRILNES